MSYKDYIDEAKEKLDNYSFDDSEYKKIYDAAYDNLSNAYRVSSNALEDSYYHGKLRAAGENALKTKNLSEELAARGLDTSGESAMLRINQAVSLNNRLSGLAQENMKAEAELARDYGDKISELNKTIATQMTNASKEDKGALYDRLAQLENLSAEEKLAAAEAAAAEEKWRAQLAADEQEWKAALNFDRYKFDREQLADENKWVAQLAVEEALTKEKLRAEEEKWRAQLEADEEEWRTKLFYSIYQDANSQGEGETEGGKTEGDGVQSGTTVDGDDLTPDIGAQTMANNIINRYADADGSLSSFGQDEVYSELARLISTSELNENYAKQILAALKSRGFYKEFSVELASEDYVKDGFTAYNIAYENAYIEAKSNGMSNSEAYKEAIAAAEIAAIAVVDGQDLDDDTKRQVLKMYGIS